jgi:CBS domain-containing protein
MDSRLAFLRTVAPFDTLPDEVLAGVADLLTEVRYPDEARLYRQSVTKLRHLDIVAEGAYETFFYDETDQQRLPEVYGPETCYGGMSILLNQKRSLRTVIARAGTRVLQLPRRDFRALCLAYEPFFQFFTHRYGQRMLSDEYAHYVRAAAPPEGNFLVADQLFSQRLDALEIRGLVTCSVDTPIYEAARRMAAARVSCLFITEPDTDTIIGYCTDGTLRDLVVAKCLDATRPVGEVVATPLVRIDATAFAYEAVLRMFQTKTKYLLVEQAGQPVGFVSRNKLLSDLAQSPFMFIQGVKLAQSTSELRRRWQKVPDIVQQLLTRGVRPEITNQVITTVADAIALRVIENVLAAHGPAPARFAFMVLGSEGRQEQTLATDQDNAIIYEDKANEHREEVRAYFLRFAEAVSDDLNHIGLHFCTGGFMAKNPKWTHSLSHWKRNYQEWMRDSSPETVMNFATFFDCRHLYGAADLTAELQAFVRAELTQPLDRFLFFMSKNALQYEPPLTAVFRNFRTFEQEGQRVFDLKKAMTPIVDLVRVYALRHQVAQTNTGERMAALHQLAVFTEKEYHELLHAYYYLMGMRLRKQAKQLLEEQVPPTNYLDPHTLTKVEQVTLKEIFKVIADFQLKIKVAFTKTL